MTETERYWLAGLLEGEGWFTKPRDSHGAAVWMQCSDKDTVEKVAALFGGKSVWKIKETRNPNWKPMYRTCLSGKNAITLLSSIFPLMSKRRQEQISAALGNGS